MDECGLFYRMEPNATLATRPVSGKKKNKDRLTVALCVNASGTEKLKPLVIGKSKRPRCFGKKFDPNQIVTYRNNKKAWMTSILFAEWLHDLDRKMNKSRRQIVLVLDNASSHIAGELELTNVTLVKLPPNATAHLQPLDQGIIKNFKAHYRTIQTHHVLECLETDHSTKIDVKQALYFIEKAWDLVKPETIFNCWRHAGIIRFPVFTQSDNDEEVEENSDVKELEDLLGLLPSDDFQMLSAEAYVTVDIEESTGETLTDSDIVEILISANDDDDNDDNDDSDDKDRMESNKTVSVQEALCSIHVLSAFLDQENALYENEIRLVQMVHQKIQRMRVTSTQQKQTSLHSYFNKSN